VSLSQVAAVSFQLVGVTSFVYFNFTVFAGVSTEMTYARNELIVIALAQVATDNKSAEKTSINFFMADIIFLA